VTVEIVLLIKQTAHNPITRAITDFATDTESVPNTSMRPSAKIDIDNPGLSSNTSFSINPDV